MFLPTTVASLPPGVMLLNHSTSLRDSTTNIEKTSQKSAQERERPSVVVKINYEIPKKISEELRKIFGNFTLNFGKVCRSVEFQNYAM